MNPLVTLCVIDDMKSVTDGIAGHIPWDSYGVLIVGTASDGEEGLQLIRERKPDIILTDIRMPNLDGLGMMTKLKEEAFTPKVIFFSGYTDFEYAQQALRLGAFDFITKPFSINQIVDIVQKAKETIEAERTEQSHLLEIKKRVKESMPILRQEFFNLLLHHRSSVQSVQRRWEFLKIDLEPEDLAVMVIEIDQMAERSRSLSIEEVELTRFSLQNIAEETIASCTKGFLFRESMSRFVAVYHCPESVQESRLAEKCCENIASHTKFTVSIGQGRKAKDVYELADAYREAIFALSYQFYAGGNVVLMYDDVARKDEELPGYSKENEQELAMSLRSGNVKKSVEALGDIFRELSAGPALPEPMVLMSVYYELASIVIRLLLEKAPYSDMQDLVRKLRDLQSLPSLPLKELQQQLLDIASQGCRRIESRLNSESQQSINEAIRYIRSRLHTDLMVNECAKHVHLSSNYFVNLFKKVTGLTFVQFLTQERMEKAKTMLLENKQVQDIATEVGYEDRRYFSDVFKKTVGMTPSEFKQAYRKEL